MKCSMCEKLLDLLFEKGLLSGSEVLKIYMSECKCNDKLMRKYNETELQNQKRLRG